MATAETTSSKPKEKTPYGQMLLLAIGSGVIAWAYYQRGLAFTLVIVTLAVGLWTMARDASKKGVGTIPFLIALAGYAVAAYAFHFGQQYPAMIHTIAVVIGVVSTLTGLFLVRESLQGLGMLFIFEWGWLDSVWWIEFVTTKAIPFLLGVLDLPF